MLHFVDREPDAGGMKSEISDLKLLAESCSRPIRAWADTLPNSDIKGQRHLDSQSRGVYEQKKKASAFPRRLARSLLETHPEIFPAPEEDE